MPADIIARGMAANAAKLAQEALDELSKVVEGTMNEELTEFTDLEGHVVTPNENTLYLDVNENLYYRWDADEGKYYTTTGSDENVKYVPQELNVEQKQQARTNISALGEDSLKTVNGESLVGDGNVAIRTWQPFDPSWPTNTTILALMQAINADPNAVVGMGYLGEVTCSGLPFGGNAEVRIEVLSKSGSRKIMLVQVTSANVFPYHWEATYWSSGLTAWRSFSEGAVLYAQSQNLTQAQKDQAKANLGLESEIYIVDYANPNYQEAANAFNNGKVVVLKGAAPDANSYAFINYVSENYITFSKFLTSKHSTYAAFNTYYLTPSNTWYTGDLPSGGRNVFLKTVEANKALAGSEDMLRALEVGGVNYKLPASTGDLTNDRFIRYDVNSQGLSDAQKLNARANINASMCRTGQRTLDAENWNNKELLLEINYLSTNDYVHIVGSSSADEVLIAEYGLGYSLENGGIRFSADETPEEDINLQIAVISGMPL